MQITHLLLMLLGVDDGSKILSGVSSQSCEERNEPAKKESVLHLLVRLGS